MKKHALIICLLLASLNYAQSSEEADIKAINKVLKKQRIAWSNNDLETYMEGYWKSDSLKFYSQSGVTYGWKNTLERYQKAYPSEEHTGKLSFRINDVSKINDGAYFVLGEYHIKREIGNADGIFMLVFKKINGEWKIIADTST
ncbi:nuclear transport factor 2 family protein [Tamlana fucoidanivorans]|uniref:Nuclear transport factor 2 family protein n=1 Tax=Allotamlana fucoidanivorans TaxID=2583814 RepID=A0A5C4SM84_9FLAO|nr:nuclear transport factor 2 family protein [Tamlana fucoidanivorans]TNJ45227.1 nuclear transport factor 2 family protein [Tamlana fucoidanivorans]